MTTCNPNLPALEAWARKNQPKWLGLDEGGE